jgi:hypothetical protein
VIFHTHPSGDPTPSDADMRFTPGQTFSEVIKSHLGRRATAADLKQVAAKLRISEDTLDAIEAQIRARRESPATAADL